MKIFCLNDYRYFRYLCVSLVVTLIDYAIFILVYQIANLLIAQVLSYSIALAFSFKLHGNYVFGLNRKTHVALSAVVSLSLIGIVVSYAVLYFYNVMVGNVYISKILLTLSMLIYNFYTKKLAYGEASATHPGDNI